MTLAIDVLGRFAVTADGAAVPADAWRSRRAADVVKLLALAPGHRMHRERVMDALWPGSGAEAAGTNLRKALHFARRALRDETAVGVERGVLVLWPGRPVTIDAERFDEHAQAAISSGDPAACAAAAGLYAGELLPDDPFEAWAAEPRARLARRFVEVLRAGRLWTRLVETDPTDEEAQRALMREHMHAGERREAIRRFEDLRDALREQLGVGPDPATVALYEEVLGAEGAEPATVAQRVHALLAWALVHWGRKEIDEAERNALQARSLALDANLGREVGEAATVLALVASARGRWRETFLQEFAASIRMGADMEAIVYDAHMCFAEYYLTGPEGFGAASAFARELLAVAQREGSRAGVALATLLLGEAELLAGRFAEAEDLLRSAVEANAREACVSGCAMALQRLAESAVAQGRRGEAGRLLARARATAGKSALSSHLLVRIVGTALKAAPDPRRAIVALRAAEAELAHIKPCEPCSMGFHVNAVAASALAGDVEGAGRHLAEAERISGMWQDGAWTAPVWEARGYMRLAQGDRERAKAMFREAADAYAQTGNLTDHDRCLHAATTE